VIRAAGIKAEEAGRRPAHRRNVRRRSPSASPACASVFCQAGSALSDACQRLISP